LFPEAATKAVAAFLFAIENRAVQRITDLPDGFQLEPRPWMMRMPWPVTRTELLGGMR
jgi:hypothetical protein